MLDLDVIEARHAAATTGKWKQVKYRYIHADSVQLAYLFPGAHSDTQANRDFIIHAHNHDIPALLGEVRWLRKELDHIKHPQYHEEDPLDI